MGPSGELATAIAQAADGTLDAVDAARLIVAAHIPDGGDAAIVTVAVEIATRRMRAEAVLLAAEIVVADAELDELRRRLEP